MKMDRVPFPLVLFCVLLITSSVSASPHFWGEHPANPDSVAVGEAQTGHVGEPSLHGRSAWELKFDDYRPAFVDEYLNRILAALRRQLVQSGLATLRLPDLKDSFERKMLGMTFHGSASLSNGTLLGLETIHRTGPSTVSAETNGDVLVESNIGVDAAIVKYDAHAEFMGLGPTATVIGNLSSIEAALVVKVNLFSFTAELSKFDVINTGDLSLQVEGLGSVLDFIGKHIGQLVGNSLKHVVLDVLEEEVKTQINEIINDALILPTPKDVFQMAQHYLMKPFQNLSSFITGK